MSPPRRQPPTPPSESKARLGIAPVFFIPSTLSAGTLASLFSQAAASTAAALNNQKKAQDNENKTKAEKSKELLDTMEMVAKLRQELQDSKKNFDDDSVKQQKRIKELEKTIADKDILIQKYLAQL